MKTNITAALIFIGAILLSLTVIADTDPRRPSKETYKLGNIEYSITPSGFLGDYKNFKIVNPETRALLWIKPPHEDLSILKGYHSIVFSPIEIWMDPDTSYHGLDPNELKVITDYFLENLQKELGTDYKIVEKDGPGVMNVRIAITGLRKEKPDYKKVYNLIPVKLVYELGYAGYRSVAGKQLDVYEASLEIEVRDTQKNERLVAAIDKHAVKGTTKKGEGSWAPLKDVLDFWVSTIKDRLAKARAS